MSEHDKHTEFLKRCIHYDEGSRRQKLVEEIHRIQRDARCVRRAAWLMAMVAALIVAGLGYGTVFAENFPYNMPQFMINLFCGLGLGSLVCLFAFMGLGMIYRMKLDHRREECRQIVTRLLEARLGEPVASPLEETGTIESASRIRATSPT